jgi:hypothetical protein
MDSGVEEAGEAELGGGGLGARKAVEEFRRLTPSLDFNELENLKGLRLRELMFNQNPLFSMPNYHRSPSPSLLRPLSPSSSSALLCPPQPSGPSSFSALLRSHLPSSLHPPPPSSSLLAKFVEDFLASDTWTSAERNLSYNSIFLHTSSTVSINFLIF